MDLFCVRSIFPLPSFLLCVCRRYRCSFLSLQRPVFTLVCKTLGAHSSFPNQLEIHFCCKLFLPIPEKTKEKKKQAFFSPNHTSSVAPESEAPAAGSRVPFRHNVHLGLSSIARHSCKITKEKLISRLGREHYSRMCDLPVIWMRDHILRLHVIASRH